MHFHALALSALLAAASALVIESGHHSVTPTTTAMGHQHTGLQSPSTLCGRALLNGGGAAELFQEAKAQFAHLHQFALGMDEQANTGDFRPLQEEALRAQSDMRSLVASAKQTTRCLSSSLRRVSSVQECASVEKSAGEMIHEIEGLFTWVVQTLRSEDPEPWSPSILRVTPSFVVPDAVQFSQAFQNVLAGLTAKMECPNETFLATIVAVRMRLDAGMKEVLKAYDAPGHQTAHGPPGPPGPNSQDSA